MHAHTAPALFKRHIDDAALAEIALQFGMRGFVLKDHDASTTGRAYYVNRMYPQVESFGAVVLNRSVGGLNPYVAEATGHLSLAEIRALQDAATEAGVTRFIVTHANWSLCKLDLEVQRELIA